MRQFLTSIARRVLRPSSGTIVGYEHPELIETIFRKTISYRPEAQSTDFIGANSVLDFGGGCGLHYKQAGLPAARWAVVETVPMVKRAKELATDRLQFFNSIQEAADWLGPIDIVHSDGALQYTDSPPEILASLCSLRAQKMIWNRVIFGNAKETQSSFLNDNGPGKVRYATEKTVLYDRRGIPEDVFLTAHANYHLTERGDDWFRYSLI